jgi:hypothetical protein
MNRRPPLIPFGVAQTLLNTSQNDIRLGSGWGASRLLDG